MRERIFEEVKFRNMRGMKVEAIVPLTGVCNGRRREGGSNTIPKEGFEVQGVLEERNACE